ncbi:MAG: Mrp/NBP35 family ATP-binding protein [Acidobacteriota bacterium]
MPDADSETLEQQVMQALGTVQDPELHQSLAALGMVENLRIEAGVARVTIHLTTPACPLKERIESDCQAAVLAVDGIHDLQIQWGARVRRSVAGESDLIPGVRNTVLVGSGKGGVGKSTVAANLALSLAGDGAGVGLLDADIYGPNQPTMMGVRGRPQGEGKKIKPLLGPRDVKLISIGFFLAPDEPVIWRGPMLHGAMRQFLGDVAWGELDYLVIDLPPGTGDVPLTLSQIIPVTGAVLVTTPQAVSLEDMKKSALALNKVNVPILGIVENMSGYTCRHCGGTEDLFGRGGGRGVAGEFEVRFLGEIPIDPRVMAGGDAGRPIVIHDPEAPAARELVKVARAVAGQVSMRAFESMPPPPRMPQPLPQG